MTYDVCKNGHVNPPRVGRQRYCKPCSDARRARPDVAESRRRLAQAYYRANKDAMLRAHRDYRKTPAGRAKTIAGNIAGRARKKGLDFDLDAAWIEGRIKGGVCQLSGLPLDLQTELDASPMSPSVDRIDATRGYTKDNCRVIAWALNAAFGHWGERQFEALARAWLARREHG